MTLTTEILSVISGGLVGFSLGLVGGGGSILATPLLLYVVDVGKPHIAIGTSALAVSVNAFANFLAHAHYGNVRWLCAVVFAAVGVLGAITGSSFGKMIDGDQLLFLFGFLMLIVGALMLRPRTSPPAAAGPVSLRTCLMTGALAFAAGAASGFFGIGGGFLIVPAIILATGMPMIQAIGSSLLAVGTFGLATAGNYAFSGLIDWPIAAAFIVGGVVGGIFGMLLANRLSHHKNILDRIFALIIFIVAAYVIYKSGTSMLA